MTAIHISGALIPTKPTRTLDARAWSWIRRNPGTAVLIVGWALITLYLAIYFGSGAWRMPT
jgi:hypothetical protein